MKYRKKSVTHLHNIEAIQYTGSDENIKEVINFCGQNNTYLQENFELVIPTLESNLTISVGDYIIKGVKGDIHHCKPDIFETSYERVD